MFTFPLGQALDAILQQLLLIARDWVPDLLATLEEFECWQHLHSLFCGQPLQLLVGCVCLHECYLGVLLLQIDARSTSMSDGLPKASQKREVATLES